MKYWVYEVFTGRKTAIVHKADCMYCKDGEGLLEGDQNRHGQWHGPYPSFNEADEFARSLKDRTVRSCKVCKPSLAVIPLKKDEIIAAIIAIILGVIFTAVMCCIFIGIKPSDFTGYIKKMTGTAQGVFAVNMSPTPRLPASSATPGATPVAAAIPATPSTKPGAAAIPATPSPKPTATAIPATPSPAPTATAIPATPSPAPTATAIPATPSPAPTATATPSPAPTATATPSPAPTATAIPATPSPTPTLKTFTIMENEYYIKNGITMIPLRTVVTAFDYKIAWDGKTATVSNAAETYILTPGINDYNGKQLEIAPEIRDSRVFAPISFTETYCGLSDKMNDDKSITFTKIMP